MLQRISEYIRVAAIHGPGNSLRPVWFDWKSEKHTVREVTYHWQQRDGNDLLLHYAVTDGATLYELVYNATEQVWLLENVEVDLS